MSRIQHSKRPRGAVSHERLGCPRGLIDVLPPYEDVWTGFALDHLSKTRILMVDIQGALQDTYGFVAAQATLAWHSRVDTAFRTRTRLLHNWSADVTRRTSCGSDFRFKCSQAMSACHGDHKWHYCKAIAPEGCDIKPYDLYDLLCGGRKGNSSARNKTTVVARKVRSSNVR